MRPPLLIQTNPLNISRAYVFALVAVVSFHLAYGVPGCQWFMGLFLYCLFRLTWLETAQQTVGFGVAIGVAVYVPHLFFLWNLFGPGAIPLWFVLPLWLGLFVFAGRLCLLRFGFVAWAVVAPFMWTGLEYFRGELYFLRFSWLNAGYAFSSSAALPFLAGFGVYGIGFLLMAWASYVGVAAQLVKVRRLVVGVTLVVVSTIPCWLPTPEPPDPQDIKPVHVTGIQLEGSNPEQVKSALDAALMKYPLTELFVLSEYTFDGPVPPEIRAWCKQRAKWLVAGGEDPISTRKFYDTVFVTGPDGAVVFQQAKCAPVPFMKDGLPARQQRLWESPWGKIGFGICYDASYTRVTDELIRQGAQGLIFPSRDNAEWGQTEHKLDARIAPMRAAEYSVPIFRLCSSGISQFVGEDGRVISSAPYPGQDAMLAFKLELLTPGRMPLDRPLAQLSVVVSGVFLLFMIVDAWWAPKLPEP